MKSNKSSLKPNVDHLYKRITLTSPSSEDLQPKSLFRSKSTFQTTATNTTAKMSSMSFLFTTIIAILAVSHCFARINAETVVAIPAKSILSKEFVNGEHPAVMFDGTQNSKTTTAANTDMEMDKSVQPKVSKRSTGSTSAIFPSQSMLVADLANTVGSENDNNQRQSVSTSAFEIDNLEKARLFCQMLAAENMAKNRNNNNENNADDYYYYSNELMALVRLLLNANEISNNVENNEENENDDSGNIYDDNAEINKNQQFLRTKIAKILLDQLTKDGATAINNNDDQTQPKRRWILLNRHQLKALNQLSHQNRENPPQFKTIKLSELVENPCKSILLDNAEQQLPLIDPKMTKKNFYYYLGKDDDSLSKKFDYLFANEGIRYKRNLRRIEENWNNDNNDIERVDDGDLNYDNNEVEDGPDEPMYIGGYKAYRLQYSPVLLRRMNWLRSVNERRGQQSKKTSISNVNLNNYEHNLQTPHLPPTSANVIHLQQLAPSSSLSSTSTSSSPFSSSISPSSSTRITSTKSIFRLPHIITSDRTFSSISPSSSSTIQSKLPIQSNLKTINQNDNEKQEDEDASKEQPSSEEGNRHRRNQEFYETGNPFAHEGIRFKKSPFQEEGIRFKKSPFQEEGIRFKKSPFQDEGIRFKKSPFQEEGIRFKKSPFEAEGIRFKKSPFQEEGIRFKKSPFQDEGIRFKKSPFQEEGIRFKKSPFEAEGIRFKKSPFQEEGIRFKKSPFEGEGIRYKKSPFEEEGIRY